MTKARFVAWVNADQEEEYRMLKAAPDTIVIGDGKRHLSTEEFKLSEEIKSQIDEKTQFIFTSHGGHNHGTINGEKYTSIEFQDQCPTEKALMSLKPELLDYKIYGIEPRHEEDTRTSFPHTIIGLPHKIMEGIGKTPYPVKIHFFSCFAVDAVANKCMMQIGLSQGAIGSRIIFYGDSDGLRTVRAKLALKELLAQAPQSIDEHTKFLYLCANKFHIDLALIMKGTDVGDMESEVFSRDIATILFEKPDNISIEDYNKAYIKFGEKINMLRKALKMEPIDLDLITEASYQAFLNEAAHDVYVDNVKDAKTVIEAIADPKNKMAFITINYEKSIERGNNELTALLIRAFEDACRDDGFEVLEQIAHACSFIANIIKIYYDKKPDCIVPHFKGLMEYVTSLSQSDDFDSLCHPGIIVGVLLSAISEGDADQVFTPQILDAVSNFIIPQISEHSTAEFLATVMKPIFENSKDPTILLPLLHRIIYQEDGSMRISEESSEYIFGDTFNQYHEYVRDQYDAPKSAYKETDIWDRDMGFYLEHGRFRHTSEIIGDIITKDLYGGVMDACVIL